MVEHGGRGTGDVPKRQTRLGLSVVLAQCETTPFRYSHVAPECPKSVDSMPVGLQKSAPTAVLPPRRIHPS